MFSKPIIKIKTAKSQNINKNQSFLEDLKLSRNEDSSKWKPTPKPRKSLSLRMARKQGKLDHTKVEEDLKSLSLGSSYPETQDSKSEADVHNARRHLYRPRTPSPIVRPKSEIKMSRAWQHDPNIVEPKDYRRLGVTKDDFGILNIDKVLAEESSQSPLFAAKKPPRKLKKIKPFFRNPFQSLPRIKSFMRLKRSKSSLLTMSASSNSQPALVADMSAGSDSGYDLGSLDSSLYPPVSSSDGMSDIDEISSNILEQEFKTKSLPSSVVLPHKSVLFSPSDNISVSSSDHNAHDSQESDTLVEDLLTVPENTIANKNFLNEPKHKEYNFKIIVVGDSGVGKTSFVHRFTTNSFHTDYKGTVGVDFATKILTLPDGRKVKLQLWDIAGQERFTWMTRVYYRESHGCIIMMDLASKKSLESVARWKDDLDSKVSLNDGRPIPALLLANKCDLKDRKVESAEVENIFSSLNFLGWCEISAKDNLMLDDAVRFLVDSMIEDHDSLEIVPTKDSSVIICKDETVNTKGCCSQG